METELVAKILLVLMGAFFVLILVLNYAVFRERGRSTERALEMAQKRIVPELGSSGYGFRNEVSRLGRFHGYHPILIPHLVNLLPHSEEVEGDDPKIRHSLKILRLIVKDCRNSLDESQIAMLRDLKDVSYLEKWFMPDFPYEGSREHFINCEDIRQLARDICGAPVKAA
ncbi:MAG: hypothetical protein M3Y72_27170 [Acidobacteriota bacterium]|nr:hypothetical protein [Acidobacteriota bacterium]